MTKQIDEERSLNVFDLFFYLWGKKRVVVIAGILGGVGGALYGTFTSPKFVSRSVISPNAQRSTLSDFVEVLPSSGGGVPLLEARLTSRSLSERVVELEPGIARILYPRNWDEDAGQWKDSVGPTVVSVAGRLRRKHLEIRSNPRKALVDISVTVPDSAYAKRIADAYLKALKESIQENISKDLEDSRIFLEAQALQAQDPQIQSRIHALIARNVEMALVNNPKDFQVVEYPSYPAGKAGPRRLRTTVAGGFVGGVGSVVLLFGLLLLTSVRSEWERRKHALSV